MYHRASFGKMLCLPTDWATGRSRFDPRHVRNEFSFNVCVQTGSEAYSASCTMGTGGPFPGAKAWPGCDADHSPPYLEPRSRISRNYTPLPPSAFMACSWTKSSPVTRHGGAWGESRYSSYLFLTSALLGVNGQRHAPTALCPGERTPGTHCTGSWAGLRAGLDTEVRGKILCLCL
jgi:hypothetical protein